MPSPMVAVIVVTAAVLFGGGQFPQNKDPCDRHFGQGTKACLRMYRRPVLGQEGRGHPATRVLPGLGPGSEARRPAWSPGWGLRGRGGSGRCAHVGPAAPPGGPADLDMLLGPSSSWGIVLG